MYSVERSFSGLFLDKLIRDASVVKFERVSDSICENIMEWEKELWSISDVKRFLKNVV